MSSECAVERIEYIVQKGGAVTLFSYSIEGLGYGLYGQDVALDSLYGNEDLMEFFRMQMWKNVLCASKLF